MSQVRRQTAVLPRPNWGWQDAAACRGEDLMLFFGPDGERQPERDIRERKAKQVCASCPVRIECLNYAVARPEKYGTWGGLNEDERSVVAFHHDARTACSAAAEAGGTAVLLHPIALKEVLALAEAGERVPRKSTSFGPKPRNGLLLRTFAAG